MPTRKKLRSKNPRSKKYIKRSKKYIKRSKKYIAKKKKYLRKTRKVFRGGFNSDNEDNEDFAPAAAGADDEEYVKKELSWKYPFDSRLHDPRNPDVPVKDEDLLQLYQDAITTVKEQEYMSGINRKILDAVELSGRLLYHQWMLASAASSGVEASIH